MGVTVEFGVLFKNSQLIRSWVSVALSLPGILFDAFRMARENPGAKPVKTGRALPGPGAVCILLYWAIRRAALTAQAVGCPSSCPRGGISTGLHFFLDMHLD